MKDVGAFLILVLVLLVIGLGLAAFAASQMDNAERAKAERVYAEASLVRAEAERARAGAEATGILLAVMIPYAAMAVASIFGLALIGLIAMLARRPAPTQQNYYILPRGAYNLPEPMIYPALPEPKNQQAMVVYQSEQEWRL